MRYLRGFVLAVAMAGLPLNADAQDVKEPAPEEPALPLQQVEARLAGSRLTLKPWLVLELDTSGLKMVRTEQDLWVVDYILVPAGKESTSFDHLRWVRDETPERTQDGPQDPKKRRRRRLGLGIGLGVGLPLLAFGIGGGLAAASISGGL